MDEFAAGGLELRGEEVELGLKVCDSEVGGASAGGFEGRREGGVLEVGEGGFFGSEG